MGNLCSISISMDDTVSRCWDCIAGQASYTCKLKQNLQLLRKELEQLQVKRDDVNWRVGLAEQKRMKRLNEVRLWLSSVQTVLAEGEVLIEDGPREIQKLRFGGCFSKHCKSSYTFGKQVTRKLAEISDLRKRDFERVAENELATQVELRPVEPTVGLEPTLVKVWLLLEQNNLGIIGLHGLGGVGKTILLTQINNKLSNNQIGYDVVLFVVVSKDHTIEMIQQKIAEKVGISSELWENKSTDDKAIDIFRVLRKKRFVLLLDDVWERVDLIKVGIPIPNQANGSKLIFTTRLLEVCGEMEAHEKIKVECLSRDEAWKLFEGKVGEETLDSHPDIRGLAKQVALKCGGLPLALITIGRAMSCKKMPQDWQYAVEVLKEFPHKFARMDQQVYSLLKFSYDSLPNDTMRSCLLYCGLYPEDFNIPINLLIYYWFCEGLLGDFDSMSRAQMQGYSIINSLLNSCLLERGELVEFVKMHDVLRDMVLWIACECEVPEKKFFVRAGLRSIKALDVKNWEVVRMSLANSVIEDLRGSPKCPNLQTLFLIGNKLKVISDGFFQFMQNLRVLNLSYNMNLCELPKEILELVALECLDLSHTGIRELPIELNKLSKLKVLNLLETYLRKIPRQLICRLSELQAFGMSSSIKHDDDDQDEDNVLNGGNEGLVEELKCLQHLNVLNIEIKSVFALESLLSFHSLQGCTVQLWLRDLREMGVLNILFLANMEHLEALVVRDCKTMEKMTNESREGRMIKASLLFPANGNSFTPCFHTLRRVAFLNCDSLKDLTWLVRAPNLTWLMVTNCLRMEEIISEEASVVGISSLPPFAKLEKLELRELPELKSIYRDALPFPCLKRIRVFNCPKLKKLPLNFDSGNQVNIQGYKEWWEELEWKNETTRSAFLHSFKCVEWWKNADLEDKAKLRPDFLFR